MVLIDLPKKGEGQIDNQPDGIALDAEGNLFVAHYGMRQVQVVSPEGKLIRSYPGGNLTTSNVAFAGPKMDRLYMTGGEPGALFRLDLPGVKGLTILPPRREVNCRLSGVSPADPSPGLPPTSPRGRGESKARSTRLEQFEHGPVELAAVPVFVGDVESAAVADAEAAGEVPERPAPAGLLELFERVVASTTGRNGAASGYDSRTRRPSRRRPWPRIPSRA